MISLHCPTFLQVIFSPHHTPFRMPRIQKSYYSPAKLICPVEGCRKECQTYSGLTQHLHAKHKGYQPRTPPSAAVNDCIILDSDSSSVNDLQMSIAPDSDPVGACDVFDPESNHDSDNFGFEMPLLPSSRPDSPLAFRESEASGPNVDYHPIING